MRITRIDLKNYRGFRHYHSLDLHPTGKNILSIDENGSGKSSLFLALEQFFRSSDQPRNFVDNRNIFSDFGDDAYIKLTFNNGSDYKWSASNTTHQVSDIQKINKYSGFLEYRDILKTHLLTPGPQVNIFELLIKTLLGDIENPRTLRRTFGENWADLNVSIPKNGRHKKAIYDFNNKIEQLNDGLELKLKDLLEKLTDVFAYFNYGKLKFSFLQTKLSYESSKNPFGKQEIILNVEFDNKDLQGEHPRFLNEAKLSAIGISIYLAALLLNPASPTDAGNLVLDDVLIGLDMSNRLPVIDILRDKFLSKIHADYQVFILTYDREWYEILYMQLVEPDKKHWKAFECHCADDDELELPVFAEQGEAKKEYLQKAEKYYNSRDYKAAAIYTRTAYEAILKHFCNKKGVPVPYKEKAKELKADALWNSVKKYEKNGPTHELYVDAKTAQAIETVTRGVLNPLSHSRPVQTYRREVQYAIIAVKRLQTELT